MTFRKTACLAAMLMCCSQTAFAADDWNKHLNAEKSADGTTVTSSGFSEVFAAGGTQKAEYYNNVYIGSVFVLGSDTFSSAVVNNNKGVMGSGLSASSVYGGNAIFEGEKGEVKGNGIVLQSGSKVSVVYGGYAYNDSLSEGECVVSGNYVTAEDGVTGYGHDDFTIYGGRAETSVAEATLSAMDNTVTVTGATVRGVFGGCTNSLKSYASNNTVILNNATAEDRFSLNGSAIIGGNVVGVNVGASATDFNAEQIASNNAIVINNSKIRSQVSGSGVIGAYSDYKVAKDTVSSSGNTVTLADTEFSGAFICGANVYMPDAYEKTSISVTANDNKIVSCETSS